MVKCSNGIIENNSFYRSVEGESSIECAIWIHQNERKVKNKIRGTFKQLGFGAYAVDDCYEHMLYYFVENTNKAFDENFHIHQEVLDRLEDVETIEELKSLEEYLKSADSSDYKMEYYILNRVKHGALGYIRHLKRQEDMLILENDAYDDLGHKGSNMITHDKASANDSNYSKNIENEPDLVAEFSYLQEMLDNDLSIYDEEFNEKNLKGFNTKRFVESMFLKDLENNEEIADDLGINCAQLNNFISGFKAIVNTDKEEYNDLKQTIQELVEGVKNGWVPIIR